jgi:hypothetical protein
MTENVNTADKDKAAGPGEGTGGDAGSGPTGAVTPEDIARPGGPGSEGHETFGAQGSDERDSGTGGSENRGPDGLIGAAVVSFVAGLATGLLLGWRATR